MLYGFKNSFKIKIRLTFHELRNLFIDINLSIIDGVFVCLWFQHTILTIDPTVRTVDWPPDHVPAIGHRP